MQRGEIQISKAWNLQAQLFFIIVFLFSAFMAIKAYDIGVDVISIENEQSVANIHSNSVFANIKKHQISNADELNDTNNQLNPTSTQ